MQIPTLLALLGTALMAVVIFAPQKAATPAGVSFAPPADAPPVERWSPSPEPFESLVVLDSPLERTVDQHSPYWPVLVDARAAHCDPTARLALVDALASVRAPWADAVLTRAFDDETDPAVRAAVARALADGYRHGEA